ncbi:MAG: hypothetical protein LBQ70_04690 [Prevotellaceae bacterium]|nr:hypothetical protein [Prevotellaceae bacterium]
MLFAEQDNFLAAAFHPELTGDTRIHEYFLDKIVNPQVARIKHSQPQEDDLKGD